MCKCKMNKNKLLALYFNEGTKREEREIRKHVDTCDECRAYLSSLDKLDQTLHLWQDEEPLPGTLDLIMAEIPVNRRKPAEAKPAFSFTPILSLVFSAAAILTAIIFLHDKIMLLPFWETIKECWCVKAFGSFGTTAMLVFLFGLFITLAITPVLILEAKSKKYKYYFN